MKQIYILTLCSILGASAAMADGGRHFQSRKAPRKSARTEAAAPMWRTSQEIVYLTYDPDEEEWTDSYISDFTYDSRGNVVQTDFRDDYEQGRSVMEYDEHDNMTSVLTQLADPDGEWENQSLRTYAYDPVLRNFCVERMGYDWEDGGWQANYFCETNAVTRDAAGNIVEILKSLPYGDTMIPAYKATWTYDETTGQAATFGYYMNYSTDPDAESWRLYGNTTYRNMQWDATDGQLTANSIYELLEGANRVTSCEVYYYDELDGYFLVEYNADKPGEYLLKETFTNTEEVGRTIHKEILDANGSYRITSEEYFDEDNNLTDEPTYTSVEEFTYDAHGNLISERAGEAYDGEEIEYFYEVKMDYFYDADGNPTECIFYDYDMDEDEYIPFERHVYGTYNDLSGVESVASGNLPATFVVYNLQGVCVATSATAETLRTLPAGLYIAGGRKVAVK